LTVLKSRLARRRQRGIAAIIITLVTMLIITLIVLGFAAISRREQRQSLDQQLSAQAFYAAESGVEDAKVAIKRDLDAGRDPVPKDNCTTNNPGGTYPVGQAMVLDADNAVSYTCLKVDMSPGSIAYDGIGDNGIVIPLEADQLIDRIQITWRPSNPPSGRPDTCPASTLNAFTPQTAWPCGYGVLRTDLVHTGGALTRGGLLGSQHTTYFQPTRSTANGTVPYEGAAGQPNVIAGNCGTANYTQCVATINNLGGRTKFSLRISSFYQPSNISIIAFNAANDPVPIGGVQAVVDVTGKATDVLRRIQVRVPLGQPAATPPAYAIQSNNAICKRFTSADDYFNIPNDIVNPDTGNLMCTPRVDVVPPPACTSINDIMMVLDTSGSMGWNWNTGTRMDNLVRATHLLIQQLNISPGGNHAGITRFSSDAQILQPYTGDAAALHATVDQLVPDGETFYGFALDRALEALNSPQARPGLPKVLIFISDGEPDGDRGVIINRTNQLKAAGVQIFTIGVTAEGAGVALLQSMAGNGGTYGAAFNEADLDRIVRSLSSELEC
jgi:uncharacterized protein YegL/Tfp pilus assembly protein PilV